MTVKVEDTKSDPLPVNAGAPQGSVLGCYLFNVGIDDLEEDIDSQEQTASQEEAHPETLVRTDDFPAMSTPVRVNQPAKITESPVAAATNFTILPRVANILHWIQRPKDPIFKPTKPSTYKYVDDKVNTNKVNMKKARLLVEDDVFFKEVIDVQTLTLLQHMADRARERGMAINAKKTGLMLVSAATSLEYNSTRKLSTD